MKLPLVRTGLLAGFMLLGFSYEKASAEVTWPSKCTQFGEVKPNQNPSFQQVNCLLTNAALEANIPPEVVKAVASQESGWKQFTDQPITPDGGIGIMQITNQPDYDKDKLISDINYNIQAGVEILSSMYNDRTDLPKIIGAGPEVIENWYFPVMAYNGTKPENSPLYQSTGSKNTNAYQEKVFAYIIKDSYLGDTSLAQFPFSVADFDYQTDSTNNIAFKKLEYSISDQMHPSNYRFKAGDKVVVTKDVNLRTQPNTSSTYFKLTKGTPLNIQGNFVYDDQSDENQFVWYPVKTADQKLAGYISSAYITNKLDSPTVSPIDDNDVSISGTALSNATIQVMNGDKPIGTAVTDENGAFKVTIPVQKAGTQLTIFYKDQYNAPSTSTTIGITDKTAPASAVVNTVNNKAAAVTGKTEANATVTATIVGKNYTAKADGYGNYKVGIPVQNAGTSISVTAKDIAGNVSAARTVKVIRIAPNIPSVNSVNNKAPIVTGKTEANATVTVTIAGKGYTTKSDGYGNFKLGIPIQNSGTSISVTAKDKAGQVSVARTMKIVKVAPNIPTVYTVNNKAAAVTGKTEANATVTATISGKAYTVKADKLGNYKVTIPVQNTGTKLSVTAKDSLGHVSVARSTTVIRVAPNQPTVNIVRYYSTNVTGKTEKYATVAVKIGTRSYTAKANVYGNYKVYIPKQRVGTKVYVYAKDAKGMVSATRSITVSK